MTTKVPDSFANEQETLFLRRNDLINRWGNAVASYQALPGLVGFWPMSSLQRSTGNVYDLSGQGRTLTYNGNPAFNYAGLVPYIELDGTGDYLSRADETDLDILGTETIYNSAVRGLAMGGWFWINNLSRTVIMSKGIGNMSDTSYWLEITAAGELRSLIGNGGVSFFGVNTAASIVAGSWYHLCMVFSPGNYIKGFVNGVSAINTTSPFASIYSGVTSFNIGTYNNGSGLFLAGRASHCFLCANALSDSLIFSLYEQSRVLFGV